MRKLFAIALLSSALLQTSVIAQPQDEVGSYPYCQEKWGGLVAAHATNGMTENEFMEKCTNCRAKWDVMVANHDTHGMTREEYLRRCSKAIAWWIPGLAILGIGAGVVIANPGGGHQPPVSP